MRDRRKRQRRKDRIKGCRRCQSTGWIVVSDEPETIMGGEIGTEIKPCECNPFGHMTFKPVK